MTGLILPERQLFLTDTHINHDPSAEQLAEMRRGVSRARGIGLDVELLEPEAALEQIGRAHV